MNNFDWLQSYYDSLPRPLRRRWRYRQWDRIHWEYFCGRGGLLSERYIEMLDFGIRNRLKIFFTPQLPNSSEIVQLWNMAQVSHLKLLPFDFKLKLRSHNREKQLRQWLDEMFLPYRLPEWCYAQWKVLQFPESLEKLVWLGRGESPPEAVRAEQGGAVVVRASSAGNAFLVFLLHLSGGTVAGMFGESFRRAGESVACPEERGISGNSSICTSRGRMADPAESSGLARSASWRISFSGAFF